MKRHDVACLLTYLLTSVFVCSERRGTGRKSSTADAAPRQG